MTPVGIEPATFRFVAQHLNHCPTVVPHLRQEYRHTLITLKASCLSTAIIVTRTFLNIACLVFSDPLLDIFVLRIIIIIIIIKFYLVKPPTVLARQAVLKMQFVVIGTVLWGVIMDGAGNIDICRTRE